MSVTNFQTALYSESQVNTWKFNQVFIQVEAENFGLLKFQNKVIRQYKQVGVVVAFF